jgi:hypothetical protein
LPKDEDKLVVTYGDVKSAVAAAIREQHTCSAFSPEEVVMVKRRLQTIDRWANVIGYAVISAVLAGIAGLAILGGLFKFGGD